MKIAHPLLWLALAGAFPLLAAGCKRESAPPAAAEAPAKAETLAAADPAWTRHLQKFEADYYVFDPSFAVMQGRHEFDGKLPDWSAEGLQKAVEWLQAVRRHTEGFAEASLPPQQRYERAYLLSVIDGELFWLTVAQAPRNPDWYILALDPGVYLTRPYAAADVRLRAFIGYLKAIPAAVAQIRGNLRTPLPRSFINYGEKAFAGYADFYRGDAAKAFAAVSDAGLQNELKAAVEPAAKAMQELASWLKSELPKANEAYALGPETFAAMLRMTEGVTTPLAELEAIGKSDLARNQAALKEACDEYLPKKSIEQCIAKMAADKPKGGPVEGARAQLAELRQLIVDKKLMSIPGTELALVDRAPPYNASNFAYIDIPGPYEQGMPSTYYIAPPDPKWSKADQDAYVPGQADLLFTSVHEIWPGHFLQFLHANRSPSPFGRVFVGYAFAEGWAHYTEELMVEAGLADGKPELRIGQLSNALLRNVRYLCAIGLHTQGMSEQECETLFRKEAHQDPGNARQQAQRGTYDPAYLNYTLGKLMIRKLRADWTASRGGREAWAAFHDQFLSYGGPPIPLVRRQMLGDKDDGQLFESTAAPAAPPSEDNG